MFEIQATDNGTDITFYAKLMDREEMPASIPPEDIYLDVESEQEIIDIIKSKSQIEPGLIMKGYRKLDE